jgi:hypothetical protein
MALLIGTRDGVVCSPDESFEDMEKVLDAGDTLRIRTSDGAAFAATKSGLYRSTDGRSWTNLDVPREEVFSVVTSPDGERLYAGTHPAHLYVSTDDGATWHELDGLQDLPSREEWHTPRHRNEAHVRSLGVHPDAPERVVAGVEVGGVHVSDDEGETWTERTAGVHGDVHHVLVLDADEYVASCGDGCYRTRDAGRSWTRLDEDLDHRYFREAFSMDGRLYAAAARGSPGTWRGSQGADAALFESTDGGDSFESVPYPGAPEEVVLGWTVHEGRVLAGTNDGRVLARESDGWAALGTLSDGIRSLTTLD